MRNAYYVKYNYKVTQRIPASWNEISPQTPRIGLTTVSPSICTICSNAGVHPTPGPDFGAFLVSEQ